MNLFKIEYGLQQQIARHIKSEDIKGKYILDIGSGSGWIEELILKKGAKKIVGIDVSENAIKQAKKLKLKKVVYKRASALDIPYKDNTFDTVVSFEVIEHIPFNTEEEMFKEVHRVLKPGGTFYLSTPYKHWLSMITDPAWWLIGHRHYLPKELYSFAKKANFRNTKTYTRGKMWTVLLLINMYLSKWIFKIEGPFYRNLLEKSREEYENTQRGIVSLFFKAKK